VRGDAAALICRIICKQFQDFGRISDSSWVMAEVLTLESGEEDTAVFRTCVLDRSRRFVQVSEALTPCVLLRMQLQWTI
jgi:hypothetical protein